MASIDSLKASDGSGNASVATVQSTRSGGATTIVVDTVQGINTNFHATMGTPHTFQDPITGEEITIISEATAVDFKGHVDGGNLEIDTIAPGYTDNGSEVGDIVIIKPTTQEQDELAEVLEVSHEDNGDIKRDAIDIAAENEEVGLLSAIHRYTYVSPDIFVDGVDQNNAANTIDWTKPTGLKFVIVEVQAGGGGGGGNTSASTNNGGGSGGGGGYSRTKIMAADLGATEVVTVGAGGAGANANSSGAAGGSSSFGAHAVATGGNGGSGGSGGAGGSGGSGTVGDILIGGQGGAGGSPTGAMAGPGGSSVLGGGAGGRGDGGVAASGRDFGGGGAGGCRIASGGREGAAGAAGIVIIKEYY